MSAKPMTPTEWDDASIAEWKLQLRNAASEALALRDENIKRRQAMDQCDQYQQYRSPDEAKRNPGQQPASDRQRQHIAELTAAMDRQISEIKNTSIGK